MPVPAALSGAHLLDDLIQSTFALILPYADLFWTGVLSVLISLIMASAFSSIFIYAIDLIPHRVGLVGALFYGLSSAGCPARPETS